MRNWTILIALAALLVACQPSDSPDESTEPTTQEHAAEADQAEATETGAEVNDAPCEVSLGWDPWEPYHYMGPGGEVQGLDIDIVSALAEDVGCELDFVQGSWAGALRLIRNGELDILLGATPTPERREYAHFSDPYREERFELYVRVEDAARWRGKDLPELLDEGLVIGVTQGYIYSDEVSELQMNEAYREQFVEAAVGELNFTHLMDHRIDGFLEDPFVFAAIDRRRNWGVAMDPVSLEVGSGEVHMLFSRETIDADLVADFNRALESLRDSGEYDAIMADYLNAGKG